AGPGDVLPLAVASGGEPGDAAVRPGDPPRLERGDAARGGGGVAAGAHGPGAHLHRRRAGGLDVRRGAGGDHRRVPADDDVLGHRAAVPAVPVDDAAGAPVVVQLAGLGPLPQRRLDGWPLAVLLPVICGAVALAHPQGVLVGMVLGVPILVWATLVRAGELLARRPGAGRRLWPFAALTLLIGAGCVLAWDVFRPSASSAVWEPNASPKEALGQA